jgi:hypothetical protein
MPDPVETEVLAALRCALVSHTRLARHLALLEPTKKLAYMLGRSEASLIETHLSSKRMPPGPSSHCNRETRLAQVIDTGGSRHATPSLPR